VRHLEAAHLALTDSNNPGNGDVVNADDYMSMMILELMMMMMTM